MKVVALDPGKMNFAYAVIHNERCLRWGQLRTITDMNVERFGDQLIRFRHDVLKAIGNLSVDDWIAFERMQHRPNLGGGAVVEYINMMIGMLLGLTYRGTRIYPVTPHVWKNRLIRERNIPRERFTIVGQKLALKQPPGSKHKTRQTFVEGLVDRQSRARNLTPHEGDAIGVGCHVWRELTGIDIIDRVLT